MELRGYQQAGVDFLRSAKRAILADEMGVGKTPQLIRAAEGDTLVVAPPALHRNWRRELDVWGRTGSLFVLSSYHGLVDMSRKDGHGHVAGVPKAQWRGPWDTVIFDEAHHLKGRNTGYANAGVKLAGSAERVYLATGTPVRNWAHELFQLLRALYPGDPRFSSYWRWVDRWFSVEEQVRYLGKRKVTNKSVGALRSITTWERFVEDNGLPGHWLRRELDDPEVDIELPPMQSITVPVTMGKHQANVYRSMEKSFFAEWDGQAIISTSTGSQWANLMRLSSGVGFHPDFDTTAASAKLDAMGDLIEGHQGPFLVFAWYHESVEVLAHWFHHRGYRTGFAHGGYSTSSNADVIDGFQQGELDVLVGSYAVLGEGHTLTVADKAIMFETSMVPAHVDQAVKRIHRFGQTRQCTVWTLVTAGTLDEYYVNRVLPAKRGQSEAVITAADLQAYRSDT